MSIICENESDAKISIINDGQDKNDIESDLESDIEIRTSSTNSEPVVRESIAERISRMSQAASVNDNNSDIFDDSEEDTPNAPNKDLDLQTMFGARTLTDRVAYDTNTAEGKYLTYNFLQNYIFFLYE